MDPTNGKGKRVDEFVLMKRSINSTRRRLRSYSEATTSDGLRRVRSAIDFHSNAKANFEMASHMELVRTISEVTEHVRAMQATLSTLHRRVNETTQDQDKMSLRYSRRLVLLSNSCLAVWIFFSRLIHCVRSRTVSGGFLSSLVVPPMPKGKSPLSALLISGFLEGFQGSLLFFYSLWFLVSQRAWKRNVGFTLSTGYSIGLAVGARSRFTRSASAIYINIFFNVLHAMARYYYLHGLLVFNDMRFL